MILSHNTPPTSKSKLPCITTPLLIGKMDSSKSHPFSFHSTSSTTLQTTTSQTYTNNDQTTSHQTNPDQPPENTTTHEPGQYVYVARRTTPNPDAQPKPKSRLSKFLSKFESSAVRQANASREEKRLEAERTGVHKRSVSVVPGNAGQSTGAFL